MSALSTYRLLRKAASRAFANDTPRLVAAGQRIRGAFEEKRGCDDATAAKGLLEAQEVISFLQKNLLQGVVTENRKDTSKKDVHVKITEDVEMGDFLPHGKPGGCCQAQEEEEGQKSKF